MLIGLFGHYFFGISIFVTSVFLVLLVLVQRGRGGGLVGALGGPGGQSALGTKAGDVFTRVTIVVAAIWIFLCASAVRLLNPSNTSPLSGLDDYSEISSDGNAISLPATTAPAVGLPATGASAANAAALPGEPKLPVTPANPTVVPAVSPATPAQQPPQAATPEPSATTPPQNEPEPTPEPTPESAPPTNTTSAEAAAPGEPPAPPSAPSDDEKNAAGDQP